MRKVLIIAWVAVFGACGAAGAADAWLTPEQVDASAVDLVETMEAAGFKPISPPEKVLDGAREMIEALRADIDERGEAGMTAIAPTFGDGGLPGSGNARLDRMGGYNLCFVALSIRVHDPAIRDDVDARLATTLGTSATYLASLYFRHRFLETGGGADAPREYAADERRKAVFDGLFRDPAHRAAVLAGCEPAVRALVANALKTLIEEALFE